MSGDLDFVWAIEMNKPDTGFALSTLIAVLLASIQLHPEAFAEARKFTEEKRDSRVTLKADERKLEKEDLEKVFSEWEQNKGRNGFADTGLAITEQYGGSNAQHG